MNDRKLILYISMSLDGYLATKDDDLSWLSVVEKEGEDYGYQQFTAGIDTYIVGRRTYDKVVELTGGSFPAAQQFECYVITRQNRKDEDGIIFYRGNVEELIHNLKQKTGKNIYCDGGSQIVKMLMEKDLIDEYIIFIIPIILGDGIPLFAGGTPTIPLKVLTTTKYDTGLVQLHYKRKGT